MDAEGTEESIPRVDNRLPSESALTDALAPPANESTVADNVTDVEGADNEQCNLKPPSAGKPGLNGKRSFKKIGCYSKKRW